MSHMFPNRNFSTSSILFVKLSTRVTHVCHPNVTIRYTIRVEVKYVGKERTCKQTCQIFCIEHSNKVSHIVHTRCSFYIEVAFDAIICTVIQQINVLTSFVLQSIIFIHLVNNNLQIYRYIQT